MKNIKFDFSNKVALVTGASSGIGREIAMQFAEAGAKVMVSDVNEDWGLQCVNQIRESGGVAEFHKCDVSKPDQVKTLIDKTISQFGNLDIACNNAGVEGQQASITDCTEENWDKVINTNLKGLWLCLKHEIPKMGKGARIVNISSIAGLIGFPGLPAYVASKHGVIGLTKTAALECAQRDIRINAICPGPIITPMLQRLMDTTPGFTEQITAGVPQHRVGTPEEVAHAVLYLASDESSYITGQYLAVDGGWVAQ